MKVQRPASYHERALPLNLHLLDLLLLANGTCGAHLALGGDGSRRCT
jgi:hypothetical protein